MDPSSDWATAVRASEILLNGNPALREDDPLALAQRTTGEVLVGAGVAEYFSQEMPVGVSSAGADEELRPIDVFYGRYHSVIRSTEVFINRINADANLFGAEPSELVEIVRIHEYAHAIVHLGIRTDQVRERLSEFVNGKKTDWATFLTVRQARFNGISAEVHELLAQAITYASLEV